MSDEWWNTVQSCRAELVGFKSVSLLGCYVVCTGVKTETLEHFFYLNIEKGGLSETTLLPTKLHGVTTQTNQHYCTLKELYVVMVLHKMRCGPG
jgi:hypothetical protein